MAQVDNPRYDTCSRNVFRFHDLKDTVVMGRARDHFICKSGYSTNFHIVLLFHSYILTLGALFKMLFCRMSQARFDVTAQVTVRVEFKHGPMVANFNDSKKQNKIEKTFFETLEMAFCILRRGYHTCIPIVQVIEYLHASTVQERLSGLW